MTSAASPETSTQVLIAGGGPVGMGLAISLGQQGIRCIVVENYEQPQPIPKGQNLTQRTMEHFYFWGAEQQLRAARTIPRAYGIGGLTAYGTLLSSYQYDWLQRELVRPFYFTDNERLPQYATEEVLRARVAQLPSVETIYGWSVQSVAATDTAARASIAERRGSGRKTIRADYIVGCDGSHSVVRTEAGMTQTLSDHDRLMVLLVFRSGALHDLLERFPGKSFYNVLHPDLEGYWQFFGRVDLGTTWFFHAPVAPGTTRGNTDFRKLLHDAAGADFDVEFEHIGFWDLRFAIADQYRAGRVFIAGDAAHSHPPYGGYGVNTGFEDAVNLGWKLAAVLQGWGGAELLDSYDVERRPVFESTARDFIAKSIEADREFLEAFDPVRDRQAFEQQWRLRGSGAVSEVQSFEPNYEGSPLVSGAAGGVCGAVGSHKAIARPGHHLAPRTLTNGKNIFEALNRGFTLLSFGGDTATVAEFVRAAKSAGIPLSVVSDTCAQGREDYEAPLVLVRPDQFVAWRGARGDAAAILWQAVGRV